MKTIPYSLSSALFPGEHIWTEDTLLCIGFDLPTKTGVLSPKRYLELLSLSRSRTAFELSLQLARNPFNLQLWSGFWTNTLKTAVQSPTSLFLRTFSSADSVHTSQIGKVTSIGTLSFLHPASDAQLAHLSECFHVIPQTSSKNILAYPHSRARIDMMLYIFSLDRYLSLYWFAGTFFAMSKSSSPKYYAEGTGLTGKTPSRDNILPNAATHSDAIAPQSLPLTWQSPRQNCKRVHRQLRPTAYATTFEQISGSSAKWSQSRCLNLHSNQ